MATIIVWYLHLCGWHPPPPIREILDLALANVMYLTDYFEIIYETLSSWKVLSVTDEKENDYINSTHPKRKQKNKDIFILVRFAHPKFEDFICRSATVIFLFLLFFFVAAVFIADATLLAKHAEYIDRMIARVLKKFDHFRKVTPWYPRAFIYCKVVLFYFIT